MRTILFIISIIVTALLTACGGGSDKKVDATMVQNPISADGVDNSVKMPAIEVISKGGTTFDFGVIIQGENVIHEFELKNTGNADLVIGAANAACGCTVPKFSKEPIAPGKTGKVEVAFASSGREGKQMKTVTLLTNAQPGSLTLTVIANIIVPN
ncbi:MAG: DUF1573 domain-containing protein [Salinivirgaceae bacterium]|jgi:hypothetical protein|nr:DUF1573 domain-containing protein [Bacteroidales bacterium]